MILEPLDHDPALESARHRREARLWLEQHKVTLITVLLGLLLPLGLFAALAEDVWSREPLRFDNPPLLWLHAHSSLLLDALMLGVTTLGGAKVMAAGLPPRRGVLVPSWRSCIGPSTSSRLEHFVICTATAGLQINAVVQNVCSAMAETDLKIAAWRDPMTAGP